MAGIFSYLAPVLLVLWFLMIIAGKRIPDRRARLLLIPAAVLISLFPIHSVSLAGYLLSAVPVFSTASTALLLVLVIRRFTGNNILSGNDIFFFSLWNILLSIVLYLSALGIIGIDLYGQGYGFSVFSIIIAMIAIVLFLLRNPLGVFFLAYLVSFQFGLLPSDNIFDHLTDGFLFLFSLGIVISSFVKKIRVPAMIDRT